MKTKLEISSNNLPIRSPISFTLLLYLVFDKWNVPEWIYGAVGFLLLLWFIGWIINVVKSRSVDIFEGWEKTGSGVVKSRFQRKLEELKNKK